MVKRLSEEGKFLGGWEGTSLLGEGHCRQREECVIILKLENCRVFLAAEQKVDVASGLDR